VVVLPTPPFMLTTAIVRIGVLIFRGKGGRVQPCILTTGSPGAGRLKRLHNETNADIITDR
jgi:hypothetical protein